MRDFLKGCGVIVGIVVGIGVVLVALILLVFGIMYPLADHSCHQYGGITHRQVKYTYVGAQCYVKMPNGWFTTDQINQNEVNK